MLIVTPTKLGNIMPFGYLFMKALLPSSLFREILGFIDCSGHCNHRLEKEKMSNQTNVHIYINETPYSRAS